MQIDSKLTMRGGVQIPRLGLGVWKAREGDEARRAVTWALEAGYRHVDTAMIYGNESSVGEAIRSSGLPREEVFVTTKLWDTDHDRPEQALAGSLRRLGLDYVDLYLMHWPAPPRLRTWREMQKFVEQGLARAVGVSNFTVRHLRELLEAGLPVPPINQVEFHPFLYEQDLMDYMREHEIVLEQYSPLARAHKFGNQAVQEVAGQYGKSPAQVLIRWGLQHGNVVIPKSSNHERIRENANVFDFELSDEDMAVLDGLDEGYRTGTDPETYK